MFWFLSDFLGPFSLVAFMIAAVMLYLGLRRDLNSGWLTSSLWIAYGLYEVGINWRMLCHGNGCVLRPDLPYILMALSLPTLWTVYQGIWGYRRV